MNHLGNPRFQVGRRKAGILVGLELTKSGIIHNKLFSFSNDGIMLSLFRLLNHFQLLGLFFQPLDSVSNGLDTFHILALGLQFCQSGLLRLKVRFLGLIG